MSPIDCNCLQCQAMCVVSVCLPTPDEARALHADCPDRMGRYVAHGVKVWAPATVGKETEVLDGTEHGTCTFHTPDGRCELHDLGRKPLEGRLASHDRSRREVFGQVLATWGAA